LRSKRSTDESDYLVKVAGYPGNVDEKWELREGVGVTLSAITNKKYMTER
jgi:hypothetical protein